MCRVLPDNLSHRNSHGNFVFSQWNSCDRKYVEGNSSFPCQIQRQIDWQQFQANWNNIQAFAVKFGIKNIDFLVHIFNQTNIEDQNQNFLANSYAKKLRTFEDCRVFISSICDNKYAYCYVINEFNFGFHLFLALGYVPFLVSYFSNRVSGEKSPRVLGSNFEIRSRVKTQ